MILSRYGYRPRILVKKHPGTRRQQQKRKGESRHIEEEQNAARQRIALLKGNAEHHGQRRPHARRPPEGKEKAECKRAEQSLSGSHGRRKGPRAVQQGNFQQPCLMYAHKDNERAAEHQEHFVLKKGSGKTGPKPHEEKYRGNSRHKGECFLHSVGKGGKGLSVGRKIAEIQRQKRQDAWRKERKYSCGKYRRAESEMKIQKITSRKEA